MVYLIQPNVNDFGYLTGGDDAITTNTAFHDWRAPYPVIVEPLSFTWTPGGLRFKPDAFAHNLLRDLACAPSALRILRHLASEDLHEVANAVLESDHLVVIQAASVLDVVDPERSVRRGPDSDVVDFPFIPSEIGSTLSRRMFRVPNRGQSLSVFVGDELKRALDANQIRGLTYVKVGAKP